MSFDPTPIPTLQLAHGIHKRSLTSGTAAAAAVKHQPTGESETLDRPVSAAAAAPGTYHSPQDVTGRQQMAHCLLRSLSCKVYFDTKNRCLVRLHETLLLNPDALWAQEQEKAEIQDLWR
ncbi:hypothetical protein TREES_T100003286 [Tupaia chinensis]|uniref:Uncharacterized protein n=1 Tax=Tupaia chinensis TaxID=246437 RepID=L9JG30_TUPCH|nr:hypothetical protein TREES_T100003286 [Tupaia chinensis]